MEEEMNKTFRGSRFSALAISFLFLVVLSSPAGATNGHLLHGVGAVNSAMGGASIAVAEDSLGAIFNNPATLHDAGPSRFDLSFELFKPQRSVESTAGPLSGKTNSESNFTPIPAFGLVHQSKSGRISHGIGALGIAGFGVDYPQDNNNPILAPPSMGGFGHVFSNYQILKIAPTMAYRMNDNFSLGFSLNLDWASLGITPMPAASPNCSGPATCFYPSASNQVGAFGVGFQMGARYQITDTFNVGLAYTSPQWFEPFKWNSSNADPNSSSFGEAREFKFRLDVPQIIGLGLGWNPSSKCLVVLDFRWINYASTRGFDEEGFDADGSVKGFGWDNIWAMGLGLRHQVTDGLALRAGYNYSQNPIPDDLSFFNIAAPAIVQHHLTAGAGIGITENVELNLAYYHVFENSGKGPMYNPAGPVPGTEVKNSLSEDSGIIQISYRF